ncbi:MAG: hypothetical protein AB7R77_26415 [Ilumatobacteraceae bacterium]
MELHDVLTRFLAESGPELAEQPERSANRLRDQLGEFLSLSRSQTSALATLVADGSVAGWVRGGGEPPRAETFDLTTVDDWARAQWRAAVRGDRLGSSHAFPPPPSSGRSSRSVTRSAGHPGEMRPLPVRRRSALGDVDFAVLPDGEVIRLVTVQATVPDPDAEVVASRVPELPAGTLGVDWVERDETTVRFGSRGATPDSLAIHLEQHGVLSPDAALPLFEFVGTTLSECHRRGVHHGALSAESIVLDGEGAPLLADAGVAEVLGRTVDEGADVRDFARLVQRALTGLDDTTTAVGVPGPDRAPLRRVLSSSSAVAQAVEDALDGRATTLEPMLAAMLEAMLGAPSAATVADPVMDATQLPSPDLVDRLPPPSPLPAPTIAETLSPPVLAATAPDPFAPLAGPAGPPMGPPPGPVFQPERDVPSSSRATVISRRTLVALVLAASVLLVGGLAWAFTSGDDDGGTTLAAATTTEPATTEAEKQSETTESVASTTTLAETTTTSTVAPTTTLPPVQNLFEPLVLADGVVAQRQWTVDGSTVVGTTTITSTHPQPVPLIYDEVFPGEMLTTLEGVTFDPPFSEVVVANAIVRYMHALDPAVPLTITYRVPVAAPPDQATLSAWAASWAAANAAHLADPVLSPVDADLDGYVDVTDTCPGEQGTYSGCLDEDNDGFPDNVNDECKGAQGTAGGCPDEDQDGVADHRDECKGSNGQGRSDGCPDSDGDGVRNVDDRCVDAKGPASNNGCPVPAITVQISGRTSVSSVNCTYSYSAVVSGGQPASYSWSSGGAVLSPSSQSTSIFFEHRGVAYTTSVNLTVTMQDGRQKSTSITVSVSPTNGC